MKTRALAATVTASFLALGVLTACGGSEASEALSAQKSAPSVPVDAKALADSAMKYAKDATSYRMAGKITGDDGKPQEIDMAISRSGNVHGTIVMAGKPVEMAKAGGTLYMKTDAETWKTLTAGDGLPASSAQVLGSMLAGKYVAVPAEAAGMGDISEMDVFKMAPKEWVDTAVARPEVTEDGRKLVPLVVKERTGEETVLYVRAEGEPQPVKMEHAADGGGVETIRFSDFNKPVEFTPPADQLVDFTDVMKTVKRA